MNYLEIKMFNKELNSRVNVVKGDLVSVARMLDIESSRIYKLEQRIIQLETRLRDLLNHLNLVEVFEPAKTVIKDKDEL